MPKDLSESVVDAWIALMQAQQTTLLKIERALRKAKLPPLAWYDVLWELDRAEEGGLRPFEIERRMLLAQSNISRLVDRLEKQGYVERRPSQADGRGQHVVLTPAGRELRRRMWPTYSKALREAVGRRISAGEASRLAGLLTKLTDKQQ